MTQNEQGQTESVATGADCCYVYCVVSPCAEAAGPAFSGIEERHVFGITHRDLCALAHECPLQPYQSSDTATASAWVLAHHRVVEEAWQRYGSVLPLTFNTIVTPSSTGNARERVESWLKAEYDSLHKKLLGLTGKAEYGVQVFWDTALVARTISEHDSEIASLQHEIAAMPRGTAYMYRQKLGTLVKKRLETQAESEFKELYERISRCSTKVHTERIKDSGTGNQMLMNLSCLVDPGKGNDLKAELDTIGRKEGFSVRMVGPMPPYSFC
ncbi:MAG: GvpL/GvpF family gas vesicle protein [Chloroflexi bacterium]|nr:GvpL/GvpF family gas vesicle protein [Chloroflexota bacterium]